MMGRGKDACWDHCVLLDASRHKVRCNYCQRDFSGTGVHRLKFHLAQIKNKDIVPCTQVPDDVRDHILRIILTSTKKQKPPKKQTLDVTKPPNHQQNSSSTSGTALSNHESNGHYDPSMSPQPSSSPLPVPDNTQRQNQENADPLISPQPSLSPPPVLDNSQRQNLENADPLMSPQPSLSPLPVLDNTKRQNQENADKKVAFFFLHNANSFRATQSVYYQEMVEAIAEYGEGYKAPSYEQMRSSLLERVKDGYDDEYKKLKDQWKETGCTILCYSWKSLVVFSVTCPKGTIFLKSGNVSGHSDDAQVLFELIESVILEVGIDDVVQVITDSSSTFVIAGRLLMAKHPSIFWSPCTSHCINEILEDFSKQEWVKTVLEEAHVITTHIDTNLMRKSTKLAKYLAGFLSLRSVLLQKDNLKHKFSGAEWSSSPMKSLLYSERFWKDIKEVVSVSEPLIKIARIVEGDMPAMGYIYEAMERAKMGIKAFYKGRGEKYLSILQIIDKRWNMQLLHSPLHAAAAFLNPSISYNESYKFDMRMRNGFQEAMLKMAKEDKVKFEIAKEHPVYLNAQGALGTDFAIMGRKINDPGNWWSAYGYEIPTLQRAAVRILSQPCSSHRCKWNWKTFENLHAKTRNQIDQEKFIDLVFVHCNLSLQAIVRTTVETRKPIVIDEIDVASEWATERDCSASAPPIDDSWLD